MREKSLKQNQNLTLLESFSSEELNPKNASAIKYTIILDATVMEYLENNFNIIKLIVFKCFNLNLTKRQTNNNNH